MDEKETLLENVAYKPVSDTTPPPPLNHSKIKHVTFSFVLKIRPTKEYLTIYVLTCFKG
jgi:hypothetical protein